MRAKRELLLWGAKGQAKVLFPILQKEYRLIGLIDRNALIHTFQDKYPVYASLDQFMQMLSIEAKQVYFSIAIGGDKGKERINISQFLKLQNMTPATLIHSTAWVAKSSQIGEGVQILGMSAVSEEVVIGDQTIINTQASVDHESVIGKGCHIMPAATLAGEVKLGDYSTIGANATILPRIRIGAHATVGAGAVVTKDVPDNVTVVGVPAAEIKIRRKSERSSSIS